MVATGFYHLLLDKEFVADRIIMIMKIYQTPFFIEIKNIQLTQKILWFASGIFNNTYTKII